jgi:hypothetical protein
VYHAYDEGSSSLITPMNDEEPKPYIIYDVFDDEDTIVLQHGGEIEQNPLALQGLEDQLLVNEEQIVQVLKQEGVSVPLVTIPHEDHLELWVFEERFDTNGFDRAHVFHYRDHELCLVA